MTDLKKKEWVLNLYPPASPEEILRAEAELALTLPESYRQLLYISNGLDANLASIYDAGSLVEMNRLYEVQQYAPGYVAIGNDGGGYHLLMKAEPEAKLFRLVSDGYGLPSEEDCIDNLEDWLQSSDGNPWRNEKQ